MLNIFHNRGVQADEQAGWWHLSDYRGTPRLRSAVARVLLRQATLGQHPPGILRKHSQAIADGVGAGPSLLTNSTLESCSTCLSGAVGICSALYLEHPDHRRPFVLSLTAGATDGYSMIPWP